MDFILMLTRDDKTVTDCRELVKELADTGVSHIGFKDVGIGPATLTQLHADIKELGATSYLEVVSTDKRSALASARIAADLGVDCLLGGTWVDETLDLVGGSSTGYYPFPGRPGGHPTRLWGTAQQVAGDCRAFEAAGCAGVDLLAYRATEADPLDLVRTARQALTGRLIVAGSVTSARQVRDLRQCGADAFTIGSALFAGSINPRAALLRTQLAAVQSSLGGSEWHLSALMSAPVRSRHCSSMNRASSLHKGARTMRLQRPLMAASSWIRESSRTRSSVS
jgi:hypothetical protein